MRTSVIPMSVLTGKHEYQQTDIGQQQYYYRYGENVIATFHYYLS
jgi:hypothetical protein